MPRTNLRALTKKLMTAAELEPAPWLGDHRERGKPPAFAKLGITASPEIVDYVALAEDPAFCKGVAAILQRKGAFYWGILPVREPASLLFSLTSSQVVAFLMGSSVLGTDPDSGAYLTGSWGDAKSSSMVASFLFDDVSPADEKPGDFVVEALSIRACLEGFGGGGGRPKSSLPECKELARLYRRGIWIAQLVQEDDNDPVDELERTMRDASPLKLYEKEREHFAKRPHFAAYWLLAHALLGRAELLEDALARTKSTKHPAIADLRKRLPSLPKLLSKHRPDWSKSDFETIRAWGKA